MRKTIEDQTKIIKDKKEQTEETEKQLDKCDHYDDIKKYKLSTDKQRDMFNKLAEEKRETMRELHSSVKFDNS